MRPVFILGIILLLVGCKQRDERVLMVDEPVSYTHLTLPTILLV